MHVSELLVLTKVNTHTFFWLVIMQRGFWKELKSCSRTDLINDGVILPLSLPCILYHLGNKTISQSPQKIFSMNPQINYPSVIFPFPYLVSFSFINLPLYGEKILKEANTKGGRNPLTQTIHP